MSRSETCVKPVLPHPDSAKQKSSVWLSTWPGQRSAVAAGVRAPEPPALHRRGLSLPSPSCCAAAAWRHRTAPRSFRVRADGLLQAWLAPRLLPAALVPSAGVTPRPLPVAPPAPGVAAALPPYAAGAAAGGDPRPPPPWSTPRRGRAFADADTCLVAAAAAAVPPRAPRLAPCRRSGLSATVADGAPASARGYATLKRSGSI
mmetsp:Transcript_12769/g.46712  ORF Transcript_12769/g.46712 Transcript_12769/m.46712 type:complete len:203 (+) Transcript_12769:1052-1660(+)